jgi:hypothetical protein
MGALKGRTSVVAALAAVGLAMGLAGCSSGPSAGAGSANASPSLGQKIQNLVLLGETNPPPIPPAQGPKVEVSCPPVDIQAGTGAYQLYEAGHQGDAFHLRYQARFGTFARECNVSGNLVTMRIGVSGRLILGPAGEAGRTIAVPVRVALLDYDDKPVFSKLTVLQVAIPAGSGGEDFREVVETQPLPIPAGRMYGWNVRVGFDTKAAAPAHKASRRRVHHHRAPPKKKPKAEQPLPSMTFH